MSNWSWSDVGSRQTTQSASSRDRRTRKVDFNFETHTTETCRHRLQLTNFAALACGWSRLATCCYGTLLPKVAFCSHFAIYWPHICGHHVCFYMCCWGVVNFQRPGHLQKVTGNALPSGMALIRAISLAAPCHSFLSLADRVLET